MSTPQAIKVSGPPPSKAKAKAAPQAKAPAAWGAPTSAPVSLAPPVIKMPYKGISIIRSEYTCLPRDGSDSLTYCGRLLFLPAITVSNNFEEVNCCFCIMRRRNE
jgi:hypothetical protein